MSASVPLISEWASELVVKYIRATEDDFTLFADWGSNPDRPGDKQARYRLSYPEALY